jgi:hypothetical protein
MYIFYKLRNNTNVTKTCIGGTKMSKNDYNQTESKNSSDNKSKNNQRNSNPNNNSGGNRNGNSQS